MSEGWQAYISKGFHPVHHGDIFNDNYEVVRKVGTGASSTVWLARDRTKRGYVALKVGKAEEASSAAAGLRTEVSILSSLPSNSSHPGRAHVPELLDSFIHEGPNGRHLCLVTTALGPSIGSMTETDFTLPLPIARRVSHQLCSAVTFLHNNNVLHRDIHSYNIMSALIPDLLSKDGKTMLDQLSIEEVNADVRASKTDTYAPTIPLYSSAGVSAGFPGVPRYLTEDCPVKEDLNLEKPEMWNIMLSDYGAAAELAGANENKDRVYSPTLRPPELILDIPEGSPIGLAADVWNLALVVFRIVTGTNLWSSWDEGDASLLCFITARLGPMPEKYRIRWGEKDEEDRDDSIDEHGRLLDDDDENGLELTRKQVLRSKPLSMSIEEGIAFAEWMTMALKWLPEERATAEELLQAEWLTREWCPLSIELAINRS